MPELPDVEVYRSYLAHTVLHHPIEEVEVRYPGLVDPDPGDLSDLEGESFEDTDRRGKYLFLASGGGPCLGLHFGMTGKVEYYREGEEDPDHSLAVFRLGNDHRLSVISVRKLGKIYVRGKKEDLIEEKDLGPDALSLDQDQFLDILDGKRGMIKSALMDQSTIAGIGNIYSDEILYQVGLGPRRKIKEIDDGERKALYEKMKDVLRTAVEAKVDPERMPRDYLIRRREPGAGCGKDSGEIRKIKVNGRSAYYCPEHQG